MHEKNKFTFDDDDVFPEHNPDDQSDPPESALSDDDFSESGLDKHNESQGLDLNDSEDFPEADLSAAFSDAEHTVEESVQDEAELGNISDSNSRTRKLLMILLLVAGAGAYYFMGPGGTKPPAPTTPVPAQANIKSVALPPPPAEPVARIAPDKQPEAVINPSTVPAAASEDKVAETKPQEGPVEQSLTKVAASMQTSEAGSAQQNAVTAASAAPQPADSAKPDGSALQPAPGHPRRDLRGPAGRNRRPCGRSVSRGRRRAPGSAPSSSGWCRPASPSAGPVRSDPDSPACAVRDQLCRAAEPPGPSAR